MSEIQLVRVGNKDPFYCAVVYCPPGPNSPFLKEFGDFLSSILKLSRLLIIGDFNIHIDDDLFARSFLSIMDSFYFTQHVSGPSHTYIDRQTDRQIMIMDCDSIGLCYLMSRVSRIPAGRHPAHSSVFPWQTMQIESLYSQRLAEVSEKYLNKIIIFFLIWP